jgi:VanZ family protein
MPDTQSRPPYLFAGGVSLAVLGLYIATLAPTTAFWDTSEYIAAAKVLGIPHPPGNPLFVLMAHVWGMLPLAADYAVRINLFAAVTSAVSAGLWALVLERWLQSIIPGRTARFVATAAGVLVAATAWTVWNQSTVNEKVYTLSMASIALVMWMTVRWADIADRTHRDGMLLAIGYILALTSTNHLMGLLVAPAVLVYVVMTEWRVILRPWAIVLGWFLLVAVSNKFVAFSDPFAGGSALFVTLVSVGVLGYALWKSPADVRVYLALFVVVAGISLNYMFLPIRAAQFPPINEGEPICRSLVSAWSGTCQPLMEVLDRAQYGKPSLMDRQSPITAQFANFLQYFGWQWARDWDGWSRLATGLFALLGGYGIVALWEKDRRAALSAIALMGTISALLVFYMNFKYGYSQHPEIPQNRHEVRERDYFYVAAFAFWGIWVGLGLAGAWRFAVQLIGDKVEESKRWLYASPLLLIALIPLVGNRVTASRATETMARDLAHDLLESVAPYGILITAGDNDTFTLWYAQEVEGIRTDVTLANLSLMNTRWHLRQLRRRVTPPFDVSMASDVWKARWQAQDVPGYPAGQAIAQPQGSVLASITEEQLDALPELQQITPGQPVPIDSVLIQLAGTPIQGAGTYLELSDLATVGLIRENLGKRPIYFSWTTGGHPGRNLGLDPYLITEGLVRRLNPAPVRPDRNIVFTPGLGFVDLDQTDQLLWNVYHVEEAARLRPRGWVDPPSASILSIYAVVYGNTAELYAQAGDSVKARRAAELAERVQANLR